MASKLQPYSALAEIYDEVMAHVDYDRWADYLAQLAANYCERGPVIELAGGTGSLAVRLAPDLGHTYVVSDNSAPMLAVARKKLGSPSNVRFKLLDFRHLCEQIGDDRFSVAIMAYDGINYARDCQDLTEILAGVSEILRPKGVFLFDQTTPANSINNLPYFGDEFEGDDYSYERSSTYDRKTRIHKTKFVIRRQGMVVSEHHVQRAFTRNEMLEAIHQTGFEVLESFEAFAFEASDDDTERIQWVIQKPEYTP